MLWNPTSTVINETNNVPVFGGMHYLYIFGHDSIETGPTNFKLRYKMPAYDAGVQLSHILNISNDSIPTPDFKLWAAYNGCMYTSIPLSADGVDWLPEGNDVSIKLRVARPYQRYASVGMGNESSADEDVFDPAYEFKIEGLAATPYSTAKVDSDLDLINVVPNPYYAYADGPGYERNQLDTRVKITNIPERCVVTIYNISGTLIRQYNVDKTGISNPSASTLGLDTDPKTSIDWDLKNYAGIPIAGGLYLIHVKETGGQSGERVIKWFGAMRPIDLNTF
jgi:hypothetical protein